MALQILTLEADVAVRRPPTPVNTRTLHITLALDDEGKTDAQIDREAHLLAAQMAAGHGEMPLATRIISVVL